MSLFVFQVLRAEGFSCSAALNGSTVDGAMFSPFCRQTFALCRLALELHTAPPCWVRLNYNDSQYKAGYNKSHILLCITRGGIRTPDLLVRSQTLYPTELRTLIIQLSFWYRDNGSACQPACLAPASQHR